MTTTSVRVQSEDFDIGAEVERLRNKFKVGAIATFTGLVRDINDGDDVASMTLEHYPGMTEKAIQAIVDEATGRWPLEGVSVIHRVGTLSPGDQIVFVGVSSGHRGAAFDACEFVMDYLKTRAPFWKKESVAGSDTRWVASRESDHKAATRWGEES